MASSGPGIKCPMMLLAGNSHPELVQLIAKYDILKKLLLIYLVVIHFFNLKHTKMASRYFCLCRSTLWVANSLVNLTLKLQEALLK